MYDAAFVSHLDRVLRPATLLLVEDSEAPQRRSPSHGTTCNVASSAVGWADVFKRQDFLQCHVPLAFCDEDARSRETVVSYAVFVWDSRLYSVVCMLWVRRMFPIKLLPAAMLVIFASLCVPAQRLLEAARITLDQMMVCSHSPAIPLFFAYHNSLCHYATVHLLGTVK